MHLGRISESFVLFDGLSRRRKELPSSFHRQLHDELCRLLRLLHEQRIGEKSDARLCTLAGQLEELAVMAERISGDDLAVLVERQLLGLVEDMSPFLALTVCRRAIARLEEAPLLRCQALLLEEQCGEESTRDAQRQDLVRNLMNRGYLRKAMELSRGRGKAGQGRVTDRLVPVVATVLERDRFRRELRERVEAGEEGALGALFERLSDDENDWRLWELVADVHHGRGDRSLRSRALYEAGRSAFRQGEASAAQRLLTESLEMSPDNWAAQNYLFTLFAVRGLVPRACRSDLQVTLLIQTLCGWRDALLFTLADHQWKGIRELAFLENLAHSLRDDNPLRGRLHFAIATIAFGEGRHDRAREGFQKALESSDEPSSLLRRIQSIPRIERVFSRDELRSYEESIERWMRDTRPRRRNAREIAEAEA